MSTNLQKNIKVQFCATIKKHKISHRTDGCKGVAISKIFIGYTNNQENTLVGAFGTETLLVSLGYYISLNSTDTRIQ